MKDAAQAHAVDVWLLCAICDRESLGGDALEPRGPTGTGDGGHGRGLMQIDDRAHPEMTDQVLPTGQPAWQDPGCNIAMGAQILAQALSRFNGDPECVDPELCSIAAYNAGYGHVRACIENLTKPITSGELVRALDAITTGGDYVSDTMIRRDKFMTTTPSPMIVLPEEEKT